MEFRAWAGNFLWPTGSNQYAERFTLGHFDLPMRNCTISLDGIPVVIKGKLQGATLAKIMPTVAMDLRG
jgi:2,5-dihydroxypyridine 5,6-dioxygenase